MRFIIILLPGVVAMAWKNINKVEVKESLKQNIIVKIIESLLWKFTVSVSHFFLGDLHSEWFWFMNAEAEMENLFNEDEAEEAPGTQSLTQEEG